VHQLQAKYQLLHIKKISKVLSLGGFEIPFKKYFIEPNLKSNIPVFLNDFIAGQ